MWSPAHIADGHFFRSGVSLSQPFPMIDLMLFAAGFTGTLRGGLEHQLKTHSPTAALKKRLV